MPAQKLPGCAASLVEQADARGPVRKGRERRVQKRPEKVGRAAHDGEETGRVHLGAMQDIKKFQKVAEILFRRFVPEEETLFRVRMAADEGTQAFPALKPVGRERREGGGCLLIPAVGPAEAGIFGDRRLF